MMMHSDQTIVLADSTKFRKVSFAQVAPLNEFDTIISTDLVPQSVRDEFEKENVSLLIAENA